MTKRYQALVYGVFAVTAALLSLVGCFRYTAHTESYRFEENLRKPMDYDYYWELNKIPNVFEGWDLSISVWSMRDCYSGQGVGKNKYRVEIWATNLTDSLYPGSRGHYVHEMPHLLTWISVDSVFLQVDSIALPKIAVVDTVEALRYPGSYRLDVRTPFKEVEILPSVRKIRISFTATLHRSGEKPVQERTFSQEMYRYSEKRKGDYWWNRCY